MRSALRDLAGLLLSPVALALVVGACASLGPGPRPGAATDEQVRATLGRPALEFPEAGGRELVYPRGPLGTETFAVHVATDGRVRSVDQVLDDAHFRAIGEGMSEDAILRRIGPPGDTMRFRSGNYAWIYRFVDSWGYLSEFSVTFGPDRTVVSKTSERVEYGTDGH